MDETVRAERVTFVATEKKRITDDDSSHSIRHMSELE